MLSRILSLTTFFVFVPELLHQQDHSRCFGNGSLSLRHASLEPVAGPQRGAALGLGRGPRARTTAAALGLRPAPRPTRQSSAWKTLD